ncbi:MAG TPA: hypothetical protein P5234_09600 [Thermoanaerobaculaceae bacterium]|nr:hypothetical protein [Thermoanaerobaculaceae bacterium]HRS16485.1 hypothetical protein [Thermoanaerobaculaceae bacterium]
MRSAAVAAAVLLAAAGAGAQGLPGSIEIGVATGRLYGGSLAPGATRALPGRAEVDDQILKGVWLGTQLGRRFGLELAVRRSSTALVGRAGGIFASQPKLAGFDLATLEALALWSFRRGSFVPYLGGGAGIANLDIDAPDPSWRDDDRLCVAAAGGARFYAARWVGARFDVRARGVYLGRRWQGDQGWRDHGRWLWNGETQLGVFFSFGGQ